jgi:chorismate synthase
MPTLTYATAGESHGTCILCAISGLPAGLPIDAARIDAALARRQGGYGRGPRMKYERDRAEFLSGTMNGRTLGTPLVLRIENRKNILDRIRPLTRVRPGHIDAAGCMKYGAFDARIAMERASARETAGRVAAGAVAAMLLEPLGVRVHAFVRAIGAVALRDGPPSSPESLAAARDRSDVYCPDARASARMVRAIARAKAAGDTLGGVVEVLAFGVPPGIGDHTRWDGRLDARIALACMGIPAAKGVEIGDGFASAAVPGSRAHDVLLIRRGRPVPTPSLGFRRTTDRAGGLEGGLANGETLRVRVAFKPIPTLMNPLPSWDLRARRPAAAHVESSDVCSVPAASVVCEAAVAFEIAAAARDKFGGDTLGDLLAAFARYRRGLRKFFR